MNGPKYKLQYNIEIFPSCAKNSLYKIALDE